MASSMALDLLAIDPKNAIAQQCLAGGSQSSPSLQERGRERLVVAAAWKPPGATQSINADLDTPSGFAEAEEELTKGYSALMEESRHLALEVGSVVARFSTEVPGHEDALENLVQVGKGHVSSVFSSGQPPSARDAARQLREAPSAKKQNLVYEDFEGLVRWYLSKKPTPSADEIRQHVVQRKQVLDSVLPHPTESYTTAALVYIERNFLEKKYVNDETMYGDSIRDIPQENFFVSEDNYAWDMSELVQCLTANSGVLRNPLSREMFTETDVRRILAHPLGGAVKLQQQKQDDLKGLRKETIDRVAKVGQILHADQSADMAPSRQAMDEFLAYVARLPASEQETINSLRIHAKDSLNGQKFDNTIGQSIQDAKGNMTCFHKV